MSIGTDVDRGSSRLISCMRMKFHFRGPSTTQRDLLSEECCGGLLVFQTVPVSANTKIAVSSCEAMKLLARHSYEIPAIVQGYDEQGWTLSPHLQSLSSNLLPVSDTVTVLVFRGKDVCQR